MFGFEVEKICVIFHLILVVSSIPRIEIEEDTTWNHQLQQKLGILIGFESLDKIRNGNIQVVTRNGLFKKDFMIAITAEFQYPIVNFKHVNNLILSTESMERKEDSFTHWIPHSRATIFWLENFEEERAVLQSVKNIKGATRRGDFVFIAKEDILRVLFQDADVKILKNKSGIILESGIIVSVPKVYLGQMMTSSEVPARSDSLVNVHGRHIRISGSKMPPYCDVRIENGKKIFSGSNFAIIHSASNKYNFTYDLDAPKGKSPGGKLKNGTWTGMLADVYNGRADITIVNAYNVERFHVIDFTSSFTVTNLVFTTAHAKTQVSLAAIVYPYNPLCWTFIIFAFIVVIPFYAIFLWFNPYGFNRDWTDVLFRAVSIPCVLGLRQETRVPHGLNFLSLNWMVFVIIIGIGYESNLVSYLSFPEPGFIPTNFIQLAHHEEFHVHFNIFSNIGRSLFQKGSSDMLKKLNKKFTSETGTVDCVIATFESDKAACVGWTDILYSAIGKNLTLTYGIDPLFMSQHSLVNNWLAFGLRKDSEYTDAFSFIASSYMVTGLVQRWKEDIISYYKDIGRGWMSTQQGTKLYQKLNQLASGNHNEPKPFRMENVQIAFIIFLLGIFISFFAFTGEVSLKFRTKTVRTIPRKAFQLFTVKIMRAKRLLGHMNQHENLMPPLTPSAYPQRKLNHMYMMSTFGIRE